MKKPETLRKAIQDAVSEFASEPDRLRLWVEEGSVRCFGSGSLSFGMEYRLNILLVEAKTDIALIVLPIVRWLQVNQPNLLTPNTDGFAFEADILDNTSCDILLRMDLMENVGAIPQEDGSTLITYLPEPDPLFDDFSAPGDLETIPALTGHNIELDP